MVHIRILYGQPVKPMKNLGDMFMSSYISKSGVFYICVCVCLCLFVCVCICLGVYVSQSEATLTSIEYGGGLCCIPYFHLQF